MGSRNLLIVIFLSSICVASGVLFGQRVIDLDKVWGDMRVIGRNSVDDAGYAVASGDVNGDGYRDIIIGAPGAEADERGSAGVVYVIFGSSSPSSTIDLSSASADITIYGANAVDLSGWAVTSGDVNGDGYDDVIIGAVCASPPGGFSAGKVYVIFGSTSPPSFIDLSIETADITIYGDNEDDELGWAMASGDINHDGYDDLIIGAPFADPEARSNAGKTYVIFGADFAVPVLIDLDSQLADINIYGDVAGDESGWALASGDINNDGYNDLIIGARWADPTGGTDAGKTYVIFGDSFSSPPYTIDLNSVSADITISGDDAYDYSGYAVASEDVNGDGYYDMIIGACGADPSGGAEAGETYVIFGDDFTPPLAIDLNTQSADITIYGDDASDYSGYVVASGDVNGDGYHDIIIGACAADPPGGADAGESYVIFGDDITIPLVIDLDTQSADITVYGHDAEDQSGGAVASGDINGDGYGDVIIGAPWADPPNGTDAGETYLISGGGAIIAAHGLGGTSQIREFSLLGRKWSEFRAFGPPNAQGEVHLAIGDIDGDRFDEIVAGQGEGGDSYVKLLEMDGSLICSFRAFGPPNTNGEVHLAIGNFDATPTDKEIAVAHGEGGDSWVKVFKADGSFLRRFLAFGPPNAQGEVHLAAGDINNDGYDEIIAGMGEGGSSKVKIFTYQGDLIRNFTAFGPSGNPGGEVHVTVGNFDADPVLEIAVATGYNGGNMVKLFEKWGSLIKRFTLFGGGNPNGEVQITAADMDNDGIWEIICGHGEGGSSRVTVFKADGTRIRSFKAFGGANSQGEVHLAKSNY